MFDFPDPFQNADPFGAFGRPPRQPNPIQPFAPEQFRSVMDQVGGNLLGGLSYLGQALNKPGRAVRGILGGQPREALNLIPFSDALGLTDHNQEVRGRDLLGFDKNDDSWTATLSGLGADIATDPLMFVRGPGAALTGLGQIARKAGVLPKNIGAKAGQAASQLSGLTAGSDEAAKLAAAAGQSVGEVAGQRLGAHVGFGLPFSDNLATFDLTTPLHAAGWLGKKALDLPTFGLGSKALNALAPAGRAIKAAFQPELMGQTSALGQAMAPNIAKSQGAQLSKNLEELAGIHRTLGKEGIDSGQQLRYLVEGSLGANDVHPAVAQAAPRVQELLKNLHGDFTEWGIPVNELEKYYPRQMIEAALDVRKTGAGRPIGEFGTGVPAMAGREKIFDVPGMSKTLEEIFADPALRSSPDIAGAAQHIVQKYKLPQEQAGALADYFRTLSPDRKELWNNPLQALQNYLGHHAQATGTARFAFPHLAEHATEEVAAGMGARNLTTILEGMGLTGPNALNKQLQILEQKQPGLLAAMGINPSVIAASPEAIKQALSKVYVPKDLAEAMMHSTKMFTVPESIKPLADVIDSITNLTKAGLTAPFPSFHARNWVSGIWQNFTAGLGLTELPKAYADARALMSQKVIPGAGKMFGGGLSDAEATKKIADLYFQHGVGGAGGHVGDIIGQQGIDKIAGQIPGLVKGSESTIGSFGQAAKDWLPGKTTWNPLDVQGVGGKLETKFAPVAAGRELGSDIETVNRLSGFIGLMRKGYAPDAAAALTKAAHVDYGNLTSFERQVMRRLVPFYGWLRGNVPYQLQQLIERPAGATAQAIRAGTELQDNKGFVPESLSAKGLAIPVGEEKEGTQRFLSQLGLPFEDLGQFLSQRGPAASAMQALSNLNPLLKGPLEYATGKQFMSGRDLADLSTQGLTGNPLVDQTIMNSPVSRVATAGRTIMDPRKDALTKAMNLSTGLRVTDVDMAKARHVAGREFVENQLRGIPEVRRFEQFYSKPADIPNLSPEELALLRLYRTLSEDAKKHAATGRNFNMAR